MVVAVDFFNMGAMENKGLNVFNSKTNLANGKTATDTDYPELKLLLVMNTFITGQVTVSLVETVSAELERRVDCL